MSKSIEQLILVLNKEYEIYKYYLELAKEKKDVIIHGKMKELTRITGKEQEVTASIQKVDQIRTQIVGNILYELNVKTVSSITELAEHLEASWKKKVLDLKDELNGVLLEIQNINELNKKLIEQALDYVELNMNMMMSLENEGSTYGNQADERELTKGNRIFDAKV